MAPTKKNKPVSPRFSCSDLLTTVPLSIFPQDDQKSYFNFFKKFSEMFGMGSSNSANLPMPDMINNTTTNSQENSVTGKNTLKQLINNANYGQEKNEKMLSILPLDQNLLQIQGSKTMQLFTIAKEELAKLEKKEEMSDSDKNNLKNTRQVLNQQVVQFEELSRKVNKSSEKAKAFYINEPLMEAENAKMNLDALKSDQSEYNADFTEELKISDGIPIFGAKKSLKSTKECQDSAKTDLTCYSPSSDILLEIVPKAAKKLRAEIEHYNEVLEGDLARCDLSTARSIATANSTSELSENGTIDEKYCENEDKNLQVDVIMPLKSPRNKVSHFSFRSRSSQVTNPDIIYSITDRLKESYSMQDRLVEENKNLEEVRYQLQEELFSKETETERLQRKYDTLEAELGILRKENSSLVDKMKEKSKDLVQQNDTRNFKEEDLNRLRDEVRRLQSELRILQKDREELILAKNCTKAIIRGGDDEKAHNENDSQKVVDNEDLTLPIREQLNSTLGELHKLEKNNQELTKQLDKSMEESKQLMNRERELEKMKAELAHIEQMTTGKNQQLDDLTQQKKMAKEEIEHLQTLIDDQALGIQEYRKKYLQAQQRVEELCRDLDQKQVELDTLRDEADNELRTVKSQYAEKLSGLEKMKLMIKEMQIKLQENNEHRILMERSLEDARKELVHALDKNKVLQKTVDAERNGRALDLVEKQKLESIIAQSESNQKELRDENVNLHSKIARIEETVTHLEQRIAEKTRELADVSKTLEATRAESARHQMRSKERFDGRLREKQIQIAELERELATARAASKAAQRERDEVRNKLQSQINSLTDTLEEGQSRWKGLQAHVTSLQHSLQPVIPSQHLAQYLPNNQNNKSHDL